MPRDTVMLVWGSVTCYGWAIVTSCDGTLPHTANRLTEKKWTIVHCTQLLYILPLNPWKQCFHKKLGISQFFVSNYPPEKGEKMTGESSQYRPPKWPKDHSAPSIQWRTSESVSRLPERYHQMAGFKDLKETTFEELPYKNCAKLLARSQNDVPMSHCWHEPPSSLPGLSGRQILELIDLIWKQACSPFSTHCVNGNFQHCFTMSDYHSAWTSDSQQVCQASWEVCTFPLLPAWYDPGRRSLLPWANLPQLAGSTLEQKPDYHHLLEALRRIIWYVIKWNMKGWWRISTKNGWTWVNFLENDF